MALVINTNVQSLNSQRMLNKSSMETSQAMERLSSGKQINSAKDDAAGLVISNRMTSQIRGLDRAVANANDGVSLIQTAEGAMEESTNILQRMRELSIQSANGIYNNDDRATLDAEVQQLVSELDRIAETTSFNGQNLLDGTLGKIDLQVGSEANQTISLEVAALDADTLGMGSTSVDLMGGASAINSLTAAVALGEGDVLINGQSIIKGTDVFDGAGATAADTDQALLDHINENVNGITASTYVEASATAAGTGILSATQSVSVTLTGLDGNDTAIVVGGGTEGTSSLAELVDKMNAESGGKFSAAIGDDGKLSISAEGVSVITVADASAALGAGITTPVNASITLKSENDDPITVTRGSTGTLSQLDFLGFRENDEAGTVEGYTVGTGNLAADTLSINGVNVPATNEAAPAGELAAKVAAINSVTDETGVSATAFSSLTLDFGNASLATLVGGDVGLNGVDVTIPGATTMSGLADAFNAVTDQTGVTATVSGTRLHLEGDVSRIALGPDAAGTTTAVTDALIDGAGTLAQFGSGNAALADVADATTLVEGGIKLQSDNGNPIQVDVKDAAATALTGLVDSNAVASGSFGSAVSSISIATQSGAQKAIDIIDNALDTVNENRAELGAINNRLDFTVSNLTNISEKTSAARSSIVDADFAAETANLSRAQVLQQASQAMLAQANAAPQQVLSLLR